VPLYEYQCKQCAHRFEKIQSFSAPEEKVCPECGGEVERLISAPAIQFKGAGWYVNDYAGRSKAPSSGADSSKDGGKDVAAKSGESSSKGDGGKSDSTSKKDSGAASKNSGSSAANSSSGSTAKSSD
jgi:putative FmdB family regulatory protein